MSGEPRLCYVDGLDTLTAFFTTRPLAEQWGDDWNDAPYEHNAGRPYRWREADGLGCRCNAEGGMLTRCWFRTQDGEVVEPSDHVAPRARWEIIAIEFHPGRLLAAEDDDRHGGNCNSPWSVEAINAGATPWLSTRNRWTRHGDEHVDVWAGATIEEFGEAVRRAGGSVGQQEVW